MPTPRRLQATCLVGAVVRSRTVSDRKKLVAAVAITAAMVSATGCTRENRAESRPNRPASTMVTGEAVRAGSCVVLPERDVSRLLGEEIVAVQVGEVTCSYSNQTDSDPVAMISIAPGELPLGNPVPGDVQPEPVDIDGVATEWKQSAMPSGIRLGSYSRGWTVTVDVRSNSSNETTAASGLMKQTLEALPRLDENG